MKSKKEFLAKSNGVTMYQHSKDVCDYSLMLLDKLGINDETIIELTKICALSHDIGKLVPYYQNYYYNDQSFKGLPRHNEIGYYILNILTQNETFTKEEREIVTHSALFHHSVSDCDKDYYLSDFFSDITDIEEIGSFFNFRFDEYGIKHQFYPISDNLDICINCSHKFSFIDNSISFNQTNKETLSKFELIFNIVRYSDYVISSRYDDNEHIYNDNRVNLNINNDSLIFPEQFNKERWDEQISIVDDLNKSNISVLEATMGYGKTLCGIRYLLDKNNNKKGIWVCPDNKLSRATYDNIMRTLSECSIDGVNVSLMTGGSYENYNMNDSDIIVTNIDTYVNGIFRNKRKTTTFEMMNGNCIFDEYHEYLFDDVPLLTRFLSVIEGRKLMSNVKTLLMSGTVINDGYVNVHNVVSPTKSTMDVDKKIKIKFIDINEANDILNEFNKNNIKNYFIINNSISKCQEKYNKFNMDYCYHSNFDKNDSDRIYFEIMSHNGKYGIYDKCNVSTTTIFSRGVDASFSCCFLINPNPLTVEQATGRLNRWGELDGATMYITYDSKDKEIYRDRNNNKRTYQIFDEYYKKYLDELKSSIDNREISIRELKELRQKIFNSNMNGTKTFIQSLYRRQTQKSMFTLSQIDFKIGNFINENKNDAKHISDNVDVRGDGLNRFFVVQKENEEFGNVSDVINLPSYRFSGDDFSELDDYYYINNIRNYFLGNIAVGNKYFDKTNWVNNIKRWKDKTLYKHLINKAKCDDTPFPILCTYKYNSEIGFFKGK